MFFFSEQLSLVLRVKETVIKLNICLESNYTNQNAFVYIINKAKNKMSITVYFNSEDESKLSSKKLIHYRNK